MTTHSSTLTSAELLLTTALRLTTEGRAPFDAEEIIVRAWMSHPKAFGMRHHNFPDSHRSYTYLCGKKGLVGRGYLCRTAGWYSLTETGKREALRLMTGEPTSNPEIPDNSHPDKPTRLPEYQDILLRRLFGAKGRGQPMADWTFTDACSWWGGFTSIDALEGIGRTLTQMVNRLAGRACVLSNGREARAEEVAELQALDAALRKRFASHLRVLQEK